MKTIKIIDLLNKNANGEEMPKKIKYNIFELKRTMSNNLLRMYVDEDGMFFPESYNGLTLNDTVEILEEEKKIPEKLKIEQDTSNSNFYIKNEFGTKCYLTKHSKILADKINEILDYLKSKDK